MRTRWILLGVAAWLGLATPARADLELDVNAALDRAVALLLAAQHDDGSFQPLPGNPGASGAYPMGATALAVFALNRSGVTASHAALQRALAWLDRQPLRRTYSVALLILALDACGGEGARPRILEAAEWLEEHVDDGLWSYPGSRPDISNTQFAALGLHVAAQHGYTPAPGFWVRVVRGCLALQADNGSFGYAGGGPVVRTSGGSSAGGLATLLIAVQALESTGERGKDLDRARAGIERAWAWLDAYFTPTGTPVGSAARTFTSDGRNDFHFYYLYGVERVAALGGRHRIGQRPWYRASAPELLGGERVGGGWGSLEGTCLVMLTLRRATLTAAHLDAAPQRRYDPPSNPAPTSTLATPPSDERLVWAYTTAFPGKSWQRAAFDDGKWPRGFAGFGSAQPRGLVPRTSWTTPELWLRRRFDLPDIAVGTRLWVFHDDAVQVWINGEPAVESEVWSEGGYREYALSADVQRALKPRGNVIAAHVRNLGGQCAFDLHVTPRATRPPRSPHWDASLPKHAVPFVERWQHFGALADPQHTQLLALELPDALRRKPSGSAQELPRSAWTPREAREGRLNLEGEADTLQYLGVVLETPEAIDGYLWLSGTRALRVWLDDAPLAFHHEHVTSPEPLRIPLRAAAGEHHLVLALEQHSASVDVVARVAGLHGERFDGLRLVLDGDASADPAEPAADAQRRVLEELAQSLPAHKLQALRKLVRFDEADALDALGLDGASADTSAWLDKTDDERVPRAKGVLVLEPTSAERPARLFVRALMPRTVRRFGATVTTLRDAVAGGRVRLGVYDGELHWLGAFDVTPGADRGELDFVDVDVPVQAFYDLDVLLVVECAPLPGAWPEPVFVDQLTLR